MAIDFSDIYITAAMTGPSSPSGDASASSEASGYPAWEAFSQTLIPNISTAWYSNNDAITELKPEWLKYHFDSSLCIRTSAAAVSI